MRGEDQLDGQEVDQGLRLLGEKSALRMIRTASSMDSLRGSGCLRRSLSRRTRTRSLSSARLARSKNTVNARTTRRACSAVMELTRESRALSAPGLALPARARAEADLLLQLVEGETRLLADHPAQKPSEEVYFRTELFAFLHLSPSM